MELIYFRDCPNVALARERLLRAFAKVRKTARWQEWVHNDPAAPDYTLAYGSPTILVNGLDVAGMELSDQEAATCRVYAHASPTSDGAPSVEDIAASLREVEATAPADTGWRGSFIGLPAVGAAALPKLTCPACWPAYSGLLSAMGVGFVDYTPYLLPLTAAFLLLALIALAWRAHRRRGYGPLFLGLSASITLLIGKFGYDSDSAVYTGIAVLVAASLWNVWPRARQAAASCAACNSTVLKS